jgi:hypothetical protein
LVIDDLYGRKKAQKEQKFSYGRALAMSVTVRACLFDNVY